MYESFFGLDQSPFENTPNTEFFFPSERHNEALAQLVYTVKRKKGFAVLTGEIGAGKTTLCRRLLRELDEDCVTAVITNPRLTGIQLLYAIAKEFSLEVEGANRLEILERLNEFLIINLAADRNVVLIVDEAQNLPLRTLEEVRLVSNLETETEKLIQILLLGQPELRGKLDHSSLVQLKQRIAMRYHLSALDKKETACYIEHRMTKAGPRHCAKFSSRAISLIYRYSGGVPRLINLVSDRSLLTAFTDDTRKISSKVVLGAIRGIEGPQWTLRDLKKETGANEGRKPFIRLPFFADRTR